MQKPFILEALIKSDWNKIAAFSKRTKNLNEFAPDETLAVLVPLGERFYINSILYLFYFFLKVWVMGSLGERILLRYFYHKPYLCKRKSIINYIL